MVWKLYEIISKCILQKKKDKNYGGRIFCTGRVKPIVLEVDVEKVSELGFKL